MQQPRANEPPADANMVLKFTYGVNAWKHWVLLKNQQVEHQRGYLMRLLKTYLTAFLLVHFVIHCFFFFFIRRAKPRLFKSDVLACTPDELNFALCQFVKEVRKPNGEEYAPDSIYYLTLGTYTRDVTPYILFTLH